MTSLVKIFKVLRCFGLFPRQFLSVEVPTSVSSQVIDNNGNTIGQISLGPLLITVMFHITMTVMNIMYMWEGFKKNENYEKITFNEIGRILWDILWIWTRCFAGWYILMNNENLVKLNNFLISLQACQKHDKKSSKKFPPNRLFWAITVPIARIALYVIFYYYHLDESSTINKILVTVTTAEDEFLKIMIEFTFWKIAKLHQGIVSRDGQLTVEALSPKILCNDFTVLIKPKSRLTMKYNNLHDSKNCSSENISHNLDLHLLQSEKYLKAINQCAQYAMSCFNYVIMFQISESVFEILFVLYFGITYKEIEKRLFLISQLVFIIPRLVLIATLSGTINREVV